MIYLDANVFLRAATSVEPVGIAARKVLSAVRTGRLEAITASLTFDELTYAVWKEMGKEAAISFCKAFLAIEKLKVKEVTRASLANSLEFMEQGMKPRDAIHCAVMKETNTTDLLSDDAEFDKILTLNRRSILEFASKQ